MLIFHGRNKVTSPYGTRTLNGRQEFHGGIDLVGLDSTDVRCPVDGIVRTSAIITDQSDRTWQWGNYVRVDDAQGRRLFFCHLASRAVQAGQTVKAGDKLGVMGNTGFSFGAHTHFEVRKADGSGQTLSPADYLGIPNECGTYTEEGQGWVYDKMRDCWQYLKGGVPLRAQWLNEGGYWYYVGANGEMLDGFQRIGGKLYYLNEKRRENIPRGAMIVTDSKGSVQK